MIFVISTMKVKSGFDSIICAAAAACRVETLKESSCLGYDLHQSLSDPETYVFVERWQTREGLDAHLATPHLLAWRAAAGEFVLSRRIEIIHPDKTEIL